MGVLAEGQGDPEGAKASYRRAIDSGHANWAPMAAVHLGILLAGQGDHEGAKASFQWAHDVGRTLEGKRALKHGA